MGGADIERQGSDPHSPEALSTPNPLTRTGIDRELEVLIRARYPLICIRTWEEERAEQLLRRIAKRRGKTLFHWTVTEGIVQDGAESNKNRSSGRTSEPIGALDAVMGQVDPAIFLFKDFHPFLTPDRCNITILRRLRDAARELRDTYKTIIIVCPDVTLAPEIQKDVTVLDLPLPDAAEFHRLLERIISDVEGNSQVRINLAGEDRERFISAAAGLTLNEAENVFAKTIVNDGELTADDIDVVFAEKRQIVRKSGLLEYYETEESFGTVAGLDLLKDWLSKRSAAFSRRAADFGLPAPRGVLLLGVQGCGKSLAAKAVSAQWRVPLLRFDIGQLFSSLVGSSEQNMRRALQTAESVAPVILWVDEIDKAFAGSVGEAGADGGTAARVFGTMLTWLSEKTSPVFVVATANDISHLPPELLRKGRLDEIFFVDLPTAAEREEIFRIHLAKRNRDPAKFDLSELAAQTEGFSGAEIEEVVIAGLFDAFHLDEDVTTDVLGHAATGSVPMSRTMSEDLNRLRKWAEGRARLATSVSTSSSEQSRRKLELE